MLDIRGRVDASARSRAVGATWVSACLHLGFAILTAIIVRGNAASPASNTGPEHPPLVVWLDRAGDLRGGGSSGNQSSKRPQQVERRGKARRTMPAARPISLTSVAIQEPQLPEITIPAVPEASGVKDVFGVVARVAVADPSSLGPRTGPGSGDGDGKGLDRGQGMNTGSGPPGPGSAINSPEIIRQVRPNYTNGALEARVRGLVVMDAVVLPDGSVGDVKIVRSLDKRFGLDEEAIKAVKQWRFRPARRSGGPIAMLVSVEMMFELR